MQRRFKTFRSAMFAVIIFAAMLSCLRAIENGYRFKRTKYVETQYGTLRGHSVDGGYLAFLGIPYAEPPIGENRFKSPKPPHSWEKVYDATRKSACPQRGQGEEDCLILNVFTPFLIPKTLLPVLVYIHGESFLMGAGPTAGVEYLVKQNIIVVTFNYRLGALGFLCLGTEDAPGNAGLKDQVAALTFVKKTIANFGGDPQRVTFYGMSAGGASVEYHILSNSSKSLFNQAIIESGSAITPWALDRNPVRTAMEVAKLLDITPELRKILFQHYNTTKIDPLTETNFEYYNNLTDGTFGFAPCVEKNISGADPFITKPPIDILKKGEFRRVPTMFMFAALEGLYLRSSEFAEQNYKDRMERSFLDFMPADLSFDSDELRNETAGKIQSFYFGKATNLIQYLNYFGDSLILHGLLNSVEEHAKTCIPVYLMEFNYKGNLGGYEKFYDTIKRAGHGDVVKYAILNKRPETESDKITVRRISRLIANFVKYGNPTPVITPLLPVRWPPVTCDNFPYLRLGHELQVRSYPYWDRKSFWDKVYAQEDLSEAGRNT